MTETEAYERVGAEGIASIVAAFYRRVREDDVLGPMYPKADLAGAEQRLRDFLLFRFGGVEDYIVARGHPRLRMRHMPFAIDERARDRWLDLMGAAMTEAGVDAEAGAVLWAYFVSTADFMRNR